MSASVSEVLLKSVVEQAPPPRFGLDPKNIHVTPCSQHSSTLGQGFLKDTDTPRGRTDVEAETLILWPPDAKS